MRNELEAARWDVLSGIANTEAGRQTLKQLVQSDAPSFEKTLAEIGRSYNGSGWTISRFAS